MDYYEGVVIQYLRANRSTFVNTEYCIQLNPGENPDNSGPHWYCDAVTLQFDPVPTIWLCEISYAGRLQALLKRLQSWNENWALLGEALRRDAHLGELGKSWPVKPCIFFPAELRPTLTTGLVQIANSQPVQFTPKVTDLEEVLPWKYRSWNRTEK